MRAAQRPETRSTMVFSQVRREMPAARSGPRRMSAERCEKCDLLIGAGCACTTTRTAARTEYVSSYRWIRFGPDALLISRRNMAHIPGACDHFTEEWVLDPKKGWGWIPPPDPSTWGRISASSPAPATEGDTSRAATIRCSDCAANL